MESPPQPNSGESEDSDTIHLAAKRGDLAKVRHFMEKGINPNELDDMGNPVIYYASLCGHGDIVKFLQGMGIKDESAPFLDPEMGRCAMNALSLEIRHLFPKPSGKGKGQKASKPRIAPRVIAPSWKGPYAQSDPKESKKKYRLPTIVDDPPPRSFGRATDAADYLFNVEDTEDESSRPSEKEKKPNAILQEQREHNALLVKREICDKFNMEITLRQARRLLEWSNNSPEAALVLFVEGGLKDKWMGGKDRVIVDPADENDWPSLSPEQASTAPRTRQRSDSWEVLSSDMGVESIADSESVCSVVPITYKDVAVINPPMDAMRSNDEDRLVLRNEYGKNSHSNFYNSRGKEVEVDEVDGDVLEDPDFLYYSYKDGGGRVKNGKLNRLWQKNHQKGYSMSTYRSYYGSKSMGKDGALSVKVKTGLAWDDMVIPNRKPPIRDIAFGPSPCSWGPKRENPAERRFPGESDVLCGSYGYQKKLQADEE